VQPRALLLVHSASREQLVELAHGDLVGRLPACRLHLDDPRVSEAHALVSLRGDALRMLSLRGRLGVDGVATQDVALKPGQRLDIGGAVSADVVEVVLPEEVVAVEGPGLPLQVLLTTTALVVERGPTPRLGLRPGGAPDAVAWLVFESDDDVGSWWIVWPDGRRAALRADVPIVVVDAVAMTVRRVPLVGAGATPTTLLPGRLRIEARYQSVQIFTEGRATPCLLNGIGARIVSELVALAGPVAWDVVAREIWPEPVPEALLRGRWDAQVSRLRARLRAEGIRPELVRSDRHGFIELVLADGDTLVDEV
jgi:hypothetical protein